VEALRWQPVGAVLGVRFNRARRDVPLAHAAALRAANPFAGIKVRGAARAPSLAAARAFSDGEWNLARTVADGLEWSYGWEAAAAQRLRFVLDFAYGTGLRASELVGATLGQIESDEHGDHWLHVVGKGSKAGKVALPPLAWSALNRNLEQRRLPTTPARWNPTTPLLGSLEQDSEAGITAARLWNIVRRFFATAAEVIGESNPATVDKLRRASPHWMRHYLPFLTMSRNSERVVRHRGSSVFVPPPRPPHHST
jgi:integrase